MNVSARPFPSQTRWFLVVSPPRACHRVIGGLDAGLLVVPLSPLWCAEGSRRAGGRARSSTRSRPPSPGRRSPVRATARARGASPTPQPWTTGRSSCRSCSSSRSAPGCRARGPRSDSATPSLPRPCADPPADDPSPQPAGTSGRSRPRPHRKSHRATRTQDSPTTPSNGFSNTP
jgi:hypothetical protein